MSLVLRKHDLGKGAARHCGTVACQLSTSDHGQPDFALGRITITPPRVEAWAHVACGPSFLNQHVRRHHVPRAFLPPRSDFAPDPRGSVQPVSASQPRRGHSLEPATLSLSVGSAHRPAFLCSALSPGLGGMMIGLDRNNQCTANVFEHTGDRYTATLTAGGSSTSISVS